MTSILIGCGSSPGVDGVGGANVPMEDTAVASRPPPDARATPPKDPPPFNGAMEGCPAARPAEAAPASELDSIAAVRARIAGIYRECDSVLGLELRPDPASEKMLTWVELDERFLQSGGRTGWMEIVSCEAGICEIEWQENPLDVQKEPFRRLVIWSDPTSIRVGAASEGVWRVWRDWMRVSD